MVAPDDGAAPESRPPLLEDLVGICRELNRQGAHYLVVGGMAIIQAGFVRATEDIDILVEAGPDNFDRVQRALMTLPDQAVRELRPTDLDQYVVVRVADEVVVDLMKSACGIDYAAAAPEIATVTIEGVSIPFASPSLLLKMKQTVRDKDKIDRAFLKELLHSENPE